MNPIRQLRDAVDTAREVADRSKAYDHPYMSEEDITDLSTTLAAVEELVIELDLATNRQGLALARLLRDRPEQVATVSRGATFLGLPEGYWLVTFNDGFECGIAPDGAVSS